MASANLLTTHDLNVLDKIKDPESGPSAPILIDNSLPKDPNVFDPGLYQRLARLERSIVLSMQQLEFQIAGLHTPQPQELSKATSEYKTYIKSLSSLINEHPCYASARNNRAQALRRIYGDNLLLVAPKLDMGLEMSATEGDITEAAGIVLSDLSTAIDLLLPTSPFAPISPQAAKTLSQAYTQRGAVYHIAAKEMTVDSVRLRNNQQLDRADVEERASRDFAMGGRYGNEIAKALAVATNPTAKLCGGIVREAMKKEFGGESVL